MSPLYDPLPPPPFTHSQHMSMFEGNLLRQPFIHNPTTDQRWSNSVLWALVMDLLKDFDLEQLRFGRMYPPPPLLLPLPAAPSSRSETNNKKELPRI